MILFALLQRLFAIASLAILATAGWLIWSWWEIEREAVGWEPSNERLWWGLGLLAFSVLGRFPLLLLLGRPGGMADPRDGEALEVQGPSGARLHVELDGRADGPLLLFTHGWGMSLRIWGDTRAALRDRFGLAFWDLPGSGRSGRSGKGYSPDVFAADLAAVIQALPADRPIVLVGHSIGGMTVQTLCARGGDALDARVAAAVLENTTHLNPLRTMFLSGLLTALQPLIEVVMRLDAVFSPLLWLMNWQSYLSGANHLAMRIAGFGSQPTWGQLDRAALLPTRTSPAVQAKGNLGMLHWKVTEDLPQVAPRALVFAGGRDLVTKDHAGEEIARLLPSAEFARIGAAGHMGPVECHADYDAALTAFVSELSAARPQAA
jgi:pimeloyl-ACP methyl ester carboxylesterase